MNLSPWIACALVLSATPDHWPDFLGRQRSDIASSSLPVTWTPADVAWSCPLPGHGQSSPVIWGDAVYVTSVEGPLKDELIVTAVGLADGRVRWQKSFPTSDPVKNGTFVSRAAPTPLVDAAGVVAFFESGDAVALDHQGAVRWQRSLSRDYGKFQNEYGLGASPLQTAELVVILIDHPGPSYVVALHKSDGTVAWRTERKGRASWSSPMWIELAGRRQLLCSSAGSIDGYDPANGRLLWSYEPVRGNRICSPWVFGSGLFLVGAQTSREFPDENSVKQSNFAMRVTPDGDGWRPQIVWRTEEASPGMASPMVHAGCAYWINRTGVVFCYDAETGTKHYAERVKQAPWATPLGVGNRLYLFGKDGLATVLEAGPQFKVLAENWLWDPDAVQADPSIVERETDPRRRAGAAMHAKPEVYGIAAVTGTLVARTGDRLYAVRGRAELGPPGRGEFGPRAD
ncbi:MAG: PQQ-binding-like beta-propeller repeat protein [Pirellulaceae bacterium]